LVTVWRDKESVVKMGELLMQEVIGPSTAVRAAVVAMKPSNVGGAKGGRKAKALKP
jgi:hypothetical protein